jgi:hypothetical protein
MTFEFIDVPCKDRARTLESLQFAHDCCLRDNAITRTDHRLVNKQAERKSMNITVRNTIPDSARITLVGELKDGSFKAKVMTETAVPYTPYWDDLLEQRIVYIQPDEQQLAAILKALNERKLSLDELQNYGSSAGGTSSIPV